MTYPIGEIESIIRPDGEVWSLTNDQDRTAMAIGGRGATGVDYATIRGFMQQSETVLGWQLAPRQIAVVLSWDVATRQDYWAARQALQRFLRPNLGGELILRHVRQNGDIREIKVRVDSSPEFANDMDWESMNETLNFIAYTPVFYDPTVNVYTFTKASPSQLVFPITFPISFDDSNILGQDQTITYAGEFPAWPTLDITGPYDWIAIQNLTTGKMVKLGQPINASQTRKIVLTPGARQIIDGNQADCFDELILPDSDLLGFNLRPEGVPVPDDPYEGVAGGVNLIRVPAGGAQTGVTALVMTYNNQYLSVA